MVGGGWGRYWSENSSTMAALEVAAAMMLASAGRWLPWRSAVASAQQASGSNWLGRGQHTAKDQQWLKHQLQAHQTEWTMALVAAHHNGTRSSPSQWH